MKHRECYCTDGKYRLYLLADEDRGNYTKLHKQINGDGSLFLNPVCKDMIWEQALGGSEEIYSIFDDAGQYCGSVEFQKPNTQHPEVEIDLLEDMRNKGIGPIAVKIATQRFLELHDIEYFIIKISSKNSHSIHILRKWEILLLGKRKANM